MTSHPLLDKLEKMEKEATEGDWYIEWSKETEYPLAVRSTAHPDPYNEPWFDALDSGKEDTKLIVESRNALKKLIKAVRVYEEAVVKDIEGAGEVTGPIYHSHIRKALSDVKEILR